MQPVGFHGHSSCPRPPRSTLGRGGRWGFWCVALPRSSWTTPGSGALRSAQSPNCPGIPLGPFEVAAHAPFPSLPCLPKRPGFSRLFTFHTDVGLMASAGSSEAFPDTGRSLQCLLLGPLNPCLPFLHSSPPPRCPPGILSRQQSQSTALPTPTPSPPPPNTPKSLTCQKPKSTARDVMGQHLEGHLTPFGAFSGAT